MKYFLLVVLICVLFTTACTYENTEKELQKSTVKVLAWNQQYFEDTYGRLLSRKFLGTRFEVFTLQDAFINGAPPSELIINLIDEKEPDIIILQEPFFRELLEKDIFLDLTNKLFDGKIDLDDVNPGVLDKSKSIDGRLLGIAPTFHSQFVIRNLDLFNQSGVEAVDSYPDMKTFTDTISLLSDTNKGVHGLAVGNGSLWGSILAFGNIDGLLFADFSQKELLIDSPSWKLVATEVVKIVQNQSFTFSDFPNPQAGDSFTQEKAAMVIGNDSYINELFKNNNKITFNWDFTLLPNNSSGQITAPSNSDEYIAIRQGTDNVDFLINLIVGLLDQESQADYLAQGKIPTVKPSVLSEELKLYLSLYDAANTNYSNVVYDDLFHIPEEVKIYISKIAEEQFAQVLSGSIDVETALNKIKESGDFYWGNFDSE